MNEQLDKIYSAARRGDYKKAAMLIEEGLRADPSLATHNNIRFAHWLSLGARWDLITKLIPHDTNFFLESGWLNSLANQKPVNKLNEPIPWYTYPAIDFLDSKLKEEWRVIEYGSGQSTLWWSKHVAKVHAIEHDKQWFDRVRNILPTNAIISLSTNQDEYVEYFTSSPIAPFDVAVIDGEFRNECAQYVSSHMKDNGIIIFDNSDRRMFAGGIEYLSNNGWKRIDFFGLIPSYLYKNCTSIFFRSDDLLYSTLIPSKQILSTGATCSQAIKE